MEKINRFDFMLVNLKNTAVRKRGKKRRKIRDDERRIGSRRGRRRSRRRSGGLKRVH